MTVLSIDPGSKKCGVSVVDDDLTIRELSIIDTENISEAIVRYLNKYNNIKVILLGDKTTSSIIENKIIEIVKRYGLKLVKVEEEFSTQEGREEFIKRKGFWKSLFKNSFDEWASYILVKRFFNYGDKV